MGHTRPLFLYFSLFYFNVQLEDKISPMLGFEPRIPGVGSDCSTNWATTTALGQRTLKPNQLYLEPTFATNFEETTIYLRPQFVFLLIIFSRTENQLHSRQQRQVKKISGFKIINFMHLVNFYWFIKVHKIRIRSCQLLRIIHNKSYRSEAR